MNPFSEEIVSKAILLIKEAEGLRSEVYKDTICYDTIEYGHKLFPS